MFNIVLLVLFVDMSLMLSTHFEKRTARKHMPGETDAHIR